MNLKTIIGLAVGAIFFTLLALNQAPYPYIWICLLWIAGLLFSMAKVNSSSSKAVLLNITVVFGCLLILEAYWVIDQPSGLSTRYYEKGYRTEMPYLGYGPKANFSAESTYTVDNEVVYDIVYDLDQNGLRLGPPIDSESCVLFFGGSFVYGEGLNNDETVPWIVGEQLKVKTLNFGFHGYGTHQMLAAIEHGKVEAAADCMPTAAVYLLNNDHPRRAAGRAWWDKYGPKYVINKDGVAVYQGPFYDSTRWWDAALAKVQQKLELSIAYQNLVRNRTRQKPDDIKNMVAIVATAKQRLEKIYPGIEFIVLHWDSHAFAGQFSTDLREALLAIPIDYFYSSSDVLDSDASFEEYYLRADGHPKAVTNKLVGTYLSEKMRSQ